MQPQYNEDTNITATSPPPNLPYAIPVVAEIYKDYSRQTSTGLSLRPYYYNAPNNGDNAATQGIGALGALPFFYNTGSYFNIGQPTVSQGYFPPAYGSGGAIDQWTFTKTNIKDVDSSLENTANFSLIFNNLAVNSFVNNLLLNGATSLPNTYPTGFGTSSEQTLSYQVKGPSKWSARVAYDSNTTSADWAILEPNENVSRNVLSNGSIGAINGTLNENYWGEGQVFYSFIPESEASMKLPTGNMLTNPLSPTGYWGDSIVPNSTGLIDTALRQCISINSSTGVISIDDALLWNYFGYGGSKINLVPDTYGNTSPSTGDYYFGLLLNDRLGYTDTNLYGTFWVELPIRIQDAGNLTTDITHTIIVSF